MQSLHADVSPTAALAKRETERGEVGCTVVREIGANLVGAEESGQLLEVLVRPAYCCDTFHANDYRTTGFRTLHEYMTFCSGGIEEACFLLRYLKNVFMILF